VSYVPAALRRQVVQCAGRRCEYCRLSQQGQAAPFHVDHVIPVAAGGPTALDNLALACVSSSLRKAARQRASDPQSDQSVPLFSPRQNAWDEHFRWDGIRIEGATATGRATVEALKMNRPLMVAIRREEEALGRHPPRS
jgi:hypothetical protein